jgi:4-nitrophenyl phosphatase
MIRAVTLDLDGTVYNGRDEVPGAADFVRFLRNEAIRPLFVTNRSNRLPSEIAAHLGLYGIGASEQDILTSAHATARFLRSGSAFCIGEAGLTTALAEQGLAITDKDPDYVVVGFDRFFDYAKLKKACRLIDAGARFIATNPDKCLKTEQGLVPGTGPIVAAVQAGSGRDPLVIGKPERLIMDMALERLGTAAAETVCVGDSLETDVPAGLRAGMRTALLLTGVSRREDIAPAAFKPTWVCETYQQLRETLWTADNPVPVPATPST